jgi:hypothetical protein
VFMDLILATLTPTGVVLSLHENSREMADSRMRCPYGSLTTSAAA